MRVLLAAFLLFGCGGAARSGRTVAAIDDRQGDELVCAEGIGWDELLAARAIYVGESHDSAEDHEHQLAVIRGIYARDPSLAIGMEMFQRPFQGALDQYVAAEIDEPALLAATEWQTRWNIDFALYRPILEFARVHRVPVIALNARRELTRAIAREGLDALGPELRAELPELDTSDAEHRAMVTEALGGHDGMDPARLERFYLAQLTWDESMAESVARTMSDPSAPRRIVVLAGRMHVEQGLGIPRRAARRGIAPWALCTRALGPSPTEPQSR